MQHKEEAEIIDDDLRELEQRILERLVSTSIGLGRDPILASIVANLYLRKELTQRELQDLTGYSAGAISEALKLFVEEGTIHENKRQGRGALSYEMKSMSQFTASLLSSSIDLALSFEEDCSEIQRGLEEMPESFRSQRLYVGLREFIALYFKFLPVYKNVKSIIRQAEEDA